MKIFSLSLLKSAPRLTKKDILLTLVPALIWWAASSARDHIIETPCDRRPEACPVSKLLPLDQMAVPLDDQSAANLSDRTQHAAGYVAFSVPVILYVGARILPRFFPATSAWMVFTDLTLLLQTMLWNGAFTETTRVTVQRPRPYVYREPFKHAGTGAHYTSFYSGHTSFTAAISMAIVFLLIGSGVGSGVIGLSLFFSIGMTAWTGALRVLGGKHFPTDVICGALAGMLVAWAVARLHRRNAVSSQKKNLKASVHFLNIP